MRLIDKIEGEKIIIAPPGIPAKVENAANDFLAPMVSDLNPILVGMSGATAFAGHWSETPKYAERRTLLQKIYYDLSLSSEERKALIAETGATLVVTLDTSSYPGSAPVEVPGKTLYSGTQLNLIQLEK
jgi:hypothetical protein